MGVSAQAMKAISIPAKNLGPQHESMSGAAADSRDSARAILIETIRQNVMAWTRWTGCEPEMKSDQTTRAH